MSSKVFSYSIKKMFLEATNQKAGGRMIRKRQEGLEWLEFDILQQFPEVVHGVFVRSGDCKEKIANNRKKIQETLGVSSLISCYQVHGDVVKQAGELMQDEACDGIFTKEKNVGLMIKHADCQAAIFYDPVHQAIASVHSGWRGNVQNIYAKTVETMQEALGTDPEDLIVCISPSLGPDRAEFINFESEFPSSFWAFQSKPYYFNLWEISRWQLEEEGVLRGNIEVASICTYDNPADFYSYRRDKVTGRNATVVALR